mmetsp:Transcript_2669/g.8010  ORF Transcript_2669/g.8010 Transcript_2669/m.8010 type:complete len:375 (+) Transcript_2669:325-1449(+)
MERPQEQGRPLVLHPHTGQAHSVVLADGMVRRHVPVGKLVRLGRAGYRDGPMWPQGRAEAERAGRRADRFPGWLGAPAADAAAGGPCGDGGYPVPPAFVKKHDRRVPGLDAGPRTQRPGRHGGGRERRSGQIPGRAPRRNFQARAGQPRRGQEPLVGHRRAGAVRTSVLVHRLRGAAQEVRHHLAVRFLVCQAGGPTGWEPRVPLVATAHLHAWQRRRAFLDFHEQEKGQQSRWFFGGGEQVRRRDAHRRLDVEARAQAMGHRAGGGVAGDALGQPSAGLLDGVVYGGHGHLGARGRQARPLRRHRAGRGVPQSRAPGPDRVSAPADAHGHRAVSGRHDVPDESRGAALGEVDPAGQRVVAGVRQPFARPHQHV